MMQAKPGRRRSRQREVVLEVLRSTDSHPTADWIYEQVRERIPNISLGTVYRNLRVLKDEGEILELDYGATFSRFDARTTQHYHFRCENCGRVFDIDLPEGNGLDGEVAQTTGFTVNRHRLEFYGKCNAC
jgi:Fur family ferric uptake transcriptional regulator/Fur family peroxide stress response transcriptional regulator